MRATITINVDGIVVIISIVIGKKIMGGVIVIIVSPCCNMTSMLM